MTKKILATCMTLVLMFSFMTTSFAMSSDYAKTGSDTFSFENAELIRVDADGVIELRIVEPQGMSRNGYPTVNETIAKIIPLTEAAKTEFLSVTRTNSNYRELADDSGSMTLYSTTKWETKAGLKGTMKRLTGFSGGIRASGSGSYISSGVSIVSNRITYGAWGKGDGGSVSGGTNITLSNSTRSYSYNRTSEWIYSAAPGEVGHTYSVGLKRGSTWYTELTNNV